MRTIQPGLWMYREHLIMQVAPDTYTVYWQGQQGWELWDNFPSLGRVRGAIECVAPRSWKDRDVTAKWCETPLAASSG